MKMNTYPRYLTFGELENSSVNVETPFTFTGKPLDDEHNLNHQYFGARYYDGEGRFTQIDPLKSMYPEYSPYIYVRNNPLRLIDPDGMADTEMDPQYNEDNIITQTTGISKKTQRTIKGVNKVLKKAVATGKNNIKQGSEKLGNAVVKTASQLETPAAIVAGGATVVAAVATSPVTVPAAAAIAVGATAVNVFSNLTQTIADPTPINIKNSAVNLVTSIGSGGVMKGVKMLKAANYLTHAQAGGLGIQVTLGAAIVNQK